MPASAIKERRKHIQKTALQRLFMVIHPGIEPGTPWLKVVVSPDRRSSEFILLRSLFWFFFGVQKRTKWPLCSSFPLTKKFFAYWRVLVAVVQWKADGERKPLKSILRRQGERTTATRFSQYPPLSLRNEAEQRRATEKYFCQKPQRPNKRLCSRKEWPRMPENDTLDWIDIAVLNEDADEWAARHQSATQFKSDI